MSQFPLFFLRFINTNNSEISDFADFSIKYIPVLPLIYYNVSINYKGEIKYEKKL